MNRVDFQGLSRLRIREARALLRLGEWAGAYYLAGYAVECALKSVISKGTRRHDFPDLLRLALWMPAQSGALRGGTDDPSDDEYGDLSHAAAAKRLGVSIASVKRWRRRDRQTQPSAA